MRAGYQNELGGLLEDAVAEAGADAVGMEGAEGEGGPDLVLDIDDADEETGRVIGVGALGGAPVEAGAGGEDEVGAVGVVEREREGAAAGEELGVGAPGAGVGGDSWAGEEGVLVDGFVAVKAEEAGFELGAYAAVEVGVEVGGAAGDLGVAVVGLEGGAGYADGDVGAGAMAV